MPEKKKSVQLSRAPQGRMMQIHNELVGNRYPNASKLAKLLEVSSKTAQRDIEYMRFSMGMPIEYDASLHGYYYSERVDALPSVQISEGEIFSLLIAEKALSQYKGTPFEQPLASAMEKIISGLRGSGHMAISHLDMAVDFKPAGISRIELENFKKISKSISDQIELEFEYRKIGQDSYEKRRVQPYRLACIQDHWYLITHDLLRKKQRTFALSRMKSVKNTQKRFERKEDYLKDEHLSAGFGAFIGEAKEDVVIEFDRIAADHIKERMWHPNQQIEELKGGRICFTIKVVDILEIERWVLMWGSEARVVKPAKLRKRILKHAEKMLKNSG